MKKQSSDDDLKSRVTVNLETMHGGALSGITNNYGSFVPPQEEDPEAMECPRATCRRLIYQDNNECAFCKLDLKSHFSEIEKKELYRLEQNRLEQIEIRRFKKELTKMVFIAILIFATLIAGLLNSYIDHNVLWLNFLPFGLMISILFMVINWNKI